MSQMCIYFTGLGIAYKQADSGGENWRVLLPFDDCHTIKFSYRPNGGDIVGPNVLAKAGRRIEIKAGTTVTSTSSTQNFDNFVLDLTGNGAHENLEPKTGWGQNGVLLTLQNAQFCVYGKYLQEFDSAKGLDVFLRDSDGQSKQDLLAHTVSANIQLADESQLEVVVDGETVLTTDPGVSFSMLFDNDCIEPTSEMHPGPGAARTDPDMDLYYGLITDPARPAKKLTVIGQAKLATENNSEGKGGRAPEKDPNAFRDRNCQDDSDVEQVEVDLSQIDQRLDLVGELARPLIPPTGKQPNLLEGKPCMFVQVKRPGNLP